MVEIAGKQLSTAQLGVIGAGAVMVIDLFLPWYRVSIGGFTASANAFDAEFLAWFPALMVIAIAAAYAAVLFAGKEIPAVGPVGPALLLAGASAVATVLLLLRWMTENNFTFIGLYLGIALAAAQAYFGFLLFKESGEPLPGKPAAGGTSAP